MQAIDPRRADLYRLFLALAAVVAIGLAGWAVAFPQSLVDLFRLEPRPSSPSLLQAFGLADGLLGIGYAYSALRLDRARPFVAVGLVVKIALPLAWLFAVAGGQLTARTLTLVIFDDVVWWLPFALLLLEGSRAGEKLRGLAPYACALLNLVSAGALLLILRPGTEVIPDPAQRIAHISGHELLWSLGWASWIAAALSLLAFYAWWATRLPRWRWAVAALLIAVAGLLFDLTAESLLIAWLPKDYGTVAPLASLLTGGPGNGLYTVAGAVLTLATPGLKGWLRAVTWTIWAAGFGLSAFTFAGNFTGVAVCTGILFVFFCPWAVVFGRRLP
jgi:hypothetical protein